MRPYTQNEQGALVPDMAAILYVQKYLGDPRCWQLVWSQPGSGAYSPAIGYCSRWEFRTMREAIAYGQKHFGERAQKAPW